LKKRLMEAKEIESKQEAREKGKGKGKGNGNGKGKGKGNGRGKEERYSTERRKSSHGGVEGKAGKEEEDRKGKQRILRRTLELFYVDRKEQAEEESAEAYLQRAELAFLRDLKVHSFAGEDTERLVERFQGSSIPAQGIPLKPYLEGVVEKCVGESTRCHSPYMLGHMAVAIPFFQRPLSKLVAALNQNIVTVEVSSTLTFLERETLSMLHRQFFRRPPEFYREHARSSASFLGCITSGGTLANFTALWLARDRALGPAEGFGGVIKEGLPLALLHYGYRHAVILGSDLLHYSMKKTADILGLGGERGLRTIPHDDAFHVRVDLVEREILRCREESILVLAVIGIAGATETGTVDDLQALASLCEKYSIHFHVDAAWGGPMIFSEQHRGKLSGIERADTITVDGHKQLYTPLGCGIMLSANPSAAKSIAVSANYTIRRDTFDAGKVSPEGSRPANSLLLHASLSIIGVEGFGCLIDHSFSLVQHMYSRLKELQDVEVVCPPETNLLLYRWLLPELAEKGRQKTLSAQENQLLSKKNVEFQTYLCHHAMGFVSWTSVFSPWYNQEISVIRVVIGNPRSEKIHVDKSINEQILFWPRFLAETTYTVPDN